MPLQCGAHNMASPPPPPPPQELPSHSPDYVSTQERFSLLFCLSGLPPAFFYPSVVASHAILLEY